MLKEAAIAVRPESSKKRTSGASVVCELLRHELGMPSADVGAMMRSLRRWRDDGARAPECERPEDVEATFSAQALALLAESDPERYRNLADRGSAALDRYGSRRAQEGMKVFRAKTEHLQRHMPLASAENDAMTLVIRDHLWPPRGETEQLPPSDADQSGDPSPEKPKTPAEPVPSSVPQASGIILVGVAGTDDLRRAEAAALDDPDFATLRSEFGRIAVRRLRHRNAREYYRLKRQLVQRGPDERITGLADYRRQKEDVAMAAFHRRLARFASYTPEQAIRYACDYVIRKFLM